MVRLLVIIFVNYFLIQGTSGSSLISVIGKHYDGDSAIPWEYQLRERLYLLKSNRFQVDGLNTLSRIIEKYDSERTNIICTACKSVVETVQYDLDLGKSEDEMLQLVRSICEYFHLFTTDICSDYLLTAGPPLIYILNTTNLDPDGVCSVFVPEYCYIEIPELSWEVELPPALEENFQRSQIFDRAETLKILHISDTHFDSEYLVGSWDECNKPLCCREPVPTDKENATIAGFWGGWKCDIPERTLDSLFDFAFNNITNISYVIWTGDIPAHDIWSQTEDDNSLHIIKTIEKLYNYRSEEFAVLPAMGNHEPVPGNLLTTPSLQNLVNYTWLYDILATNWTSGWLPISVQDTIRYGGFYSVKIRPSLRLISLNTVFCYSLNWWLVLDSKDPAGQLTWLINELYNAEMMGEKVQIIGHVPPGGTECLPQWRKNYYRIVNRFRDIIVGQFFGHTHNDEFELILSEQDNQTAVGLMFLAASATTYTYTNPSFRIYYMDGSTNEITDHETWILDLEKSNQLGDPMWRKLYSAKDAYGINALSPQNFFELYRRLESDNELMDLYDRFYWSDSPKRNTCDDKCHHQHLCEILNCQTYSQ